MLLLEALELYGLGNWQRIAQHVGRPDLECRQHYYEVYVKLILFLFPSLPKLG